MRSRNVGKRERIGTSGPHPLSVDPARTKGYDPRFVSNSDPDRGDGSPSAPPAETSTSAPDAEAPAPEAEGPAQKPLPHVDTTPTGAAHPKPTSKPEEEEDPDVYRVKLDVFEGPLDLLLHLIRKHELDILDIPVSFITEKYLEYMKMMQQLQIDVASEYLVMAATLTHIKSKMLLPADPSEDGDEEEEEEIDPRAELVRQLLEYQKYRHAASQLQLRATLGRDAFPRGDEEPEPDGPAPLAPLNVFKLFDAFERVLKRAAKDTDHQIMFERVNIADRIVQLTELLSKKRRLPFEELFISPDDEDEEGEEHRIPTRLEMVITFLAILEMGKMRVVRIVQDDTLGPILVEMPAKTLDERDDAPLDWSALGDESPPRTSSDSPPDAPPSTPEPAPAEEPTPAEEPASTEEPASPETSTSGAPFAPEPIPAEATPPGEADDTP